MLGINWLIAEFFITLSRFDFWVHGIPSPDYYDAGGTVSASLLSCASKYFFNSSFLSTVEYEDSDYGDMPRTKPKKIHVNEEEEYFNRPKEIKTQTVYKSCDKKSNLYVMQQDKFIKGDGFFHETEPVNPME